MVEILIGIPSAGKPGVHLITDSQYGASGRTVGIKSHQIYKNYPNPASL
jgi:hypothetical protein